MNRDDLRAKAKAARAAIAAHAALNEDDRAEGAAYARMEAAVEALREAVTPDVVLELIGPPFDPAALRAKALAATPGPWSAGTPQSRGGSWYAVPVHVGDGGNRGNALAIVELGGTGATDPTKAATSANAAYIAAIDPTTLLALLSERDALVARLREQEIRTAREADWVVSEMQRAEAAEAERDALAARVAGLVAALSDIAHRSMFSSKERIVEHARAALVPAATASEGPCPV